jgi:hypothetical protein
VLDQAIALELAKRLREHLLADPAYAIAKLAVSERAGAKPGDHYDGPRVGDKLQGRAGRAVLQKEVIATHPVEDMP